MTHFCGVLLAPGVDADSGERLVRAMLADFGHEGHRFEVVSAAGLHLGFAVPTAFARDMEGGPPVIRSDGHLGFGDVTLWNRGRIDPQTQGATDLAAFHAHFCRGGDLGAVSGDFAFGSYEPGAGRLTLIRDQLGVRTVVHYERPEGFIFASNARFFSGAGLTPDPLALGSFLMMRHPGVGRFYLDGVAELPAAHQLSALRGGLQRTSRYWSIGSTPDPGYRTAEDCIEHVRERFVHAVKARISGSRRPAVALSGGLDSSSIAGVMASMDPGREVLAFAHRPGPGAPPNDPNDDGPHIASVARHWPNIRLRELTSLDADLFSGAESWHGRGLIPCPEPFFAGGEAIVRAAFEAGADVLLDGLFGDDALSAAGGSVLIEALLAGRFGLAAREWRRLRTNGLESAGRLVRQKVVAPLLPSGLRRLRRKLDGARWAAAYPIRQDFWTDGAFRDHLDENVPSMQPPVPRSLRQRIASSFDPALAQSLMFQDRTDGQSALRLRHPMLDTELLAAVYWTPAEHFVSATQDRELIRKVAAPILPDDVRTRRGKAPFMPDFPTRLRERLPALLDQITAFEAHPVWRDMIDPAAIRREAKLVLDGGQPVNATRAITFFFQPYFIGRYLELGARG